MRFFLAFLVTWSGQHLWAQSAKELTKVVQHQVVQTGATRPLYLKEVQQLDKPGKPTEAQRFQLVPALTEGSVRMVSGSEVVGEFADEILVATERVATDAQLRGFFDFETRGDTLIARRKADAEHRIDLVEQHLVYDAARQRLFYIFSAIDRRSVFYSSRFRVTVFFSTDGLYQRHTLRFSSNLFLLGSQGSIAINGRLAG